MSKLRTSSLPLSWILQDVRYAIRTLQFSPGFATICILILALGIGANTVIFTAVNSVLIRPLQYPNSRQLVVVWERNLEHGFPRFPLSPANYRDYAEQSHVFSALAAYGAQGFNLTEGVEAERVRGAQVTPNFFDTMGIHPLMGRGFAPSEAQFGGPKAAILGYGIWQRRFGGRSNVVGQSVTLDGTAYQIVGVMPAGFDFPRRSDVWTPLSYPPQRFQVRGAHWLGGIARLKSGVDIAAAQAELSLIARRLQKQYPDTNAGWDAFLADMLDETVSKVRPKLLTLLAAVGFVLLIACANFANLLLTRSAARRREVGIRIALGAGRGRLIGQFLTEGLLLSLTGGILGVGLSWSTARALSKLAPTVLPRAAEINLDFRVLAFTFAITVLTGLLFGLTPALCLDRRVATSVIVRAVQGPSLGFRRNRVRAALVVIEVALALVLLTGAGLLMRSFYRLQDVDPGFEPREVMTFQTFLPMQHYPKDEQVVDLYQRAVDEIRAMPGVSAAGAAEILPFGENTMATGFSVVGRPPKPSGKGDDATYYSVTPGYFEALRIPLKSGRFFNERDRGIDGSYGVAIISEAMAKQFFHGQNPLGQALSIGGNKPSVIVGVVGDVAQSGLDEKAGPAMYQPAAQVPYHAMQFVARTKLETSSFATSIRESIHRVDPELPVDAIGPFEELISGSLAQRRLAMSLMAGFAAFALALALLGIYGVISHAVSNAKKEIGIRMALGAKRADVVRLVFRYSAALLSAGLVAGFLGALAAGRILASELFEIPAADPTTLISVAAVLLVTGFAACLIPALSAMRVDPAVTLRYE